MSINYGSSVGGSGVHDWETVGSSDMTGDGYFANPVAFDGTNDYLTRGADYTDGADSKLWTGSLWFRRTGGEGAGQRIVEATSTGIVVDFQGDNTFRVFARNAANANILSITTSAVTGTAWHHVMWSVDLSSTSLRHLYLDGASDLTAVAYTNDTMDLTRAEHSVGASVTGTSKLNANLADVQMWFGEYIDLSVSANRRLFLADGMPISPGIARAALGAPILRLSGPTADWHTNKGTGGGLTETGALTAGTGIVRLA